ncbi:hypothetical protein H4R26_002325 [Coemansia thaxteri]|uniref:Uncharacterized protein n=1 Tax=Coemansia thaxteri TaxID=2663907 RepID=A0A9W8EIK3_9FUNG|nr:hypothetical protein H4R26_002325 [Coemansia thaxteri]KAJ2487972.1 hypothetical protein EV174_000209 [Coemansia sp. RSA 2320]
MVLDAQWAAPLETFFQRTELFQCLRALQLEAVVFAPAVRGDLYDSLRSLAEDIQAFVAAKQQLAPLDPNALPESSMDVDFAASASPMEGGDTRLSKVPQLAEKHKAIMLDAVQVTLTKDQTQQAMDEFVGRQRKEIDRNNQEEFLIPASGRDSTCARIDAKGANHGVQVQLDATFSGSGALERSRAAQASTVSSSNAVSTHSKPLEGLFERVESLSEHLNVRFVPAKASIYSKVSALEDRVMMLEREFPPWSAQHFNQPGRNYNQPPPETVYRILSTSDPAASPAASLAASTPATAPTSVISKPVPVALPRPVGRGRPKLPDFISARTKSTPRRRKIGASVNTPLDSTGKPIFHICGRGVNSSLTRSVLAQLQSKQDPARPNPNHAGDTATDYDQ